MCRSIYIWLHVWCKLALRVYFRQLEYLENNRVVRKYPIEMLSNKMSLCAFVIKHSLSLQYLQFTETNSSKLLRFGRFFSLSSIQIKYIYKHKSKYVFDV